jgi:rhodanese-related sulfurtransferase
MSAIIGIDRVERKELKWRMDRAETFVLLEIATEEEYRKGHLPGALCVPPERVADLVPELAPDRDVEVIVYCDHSDMNDGRRAARELEALGYNNVRSYDAGKRDWVAHGFPLENEGERAIFAAGPAPSGRITD